ncbi:hypothetical protein [Psychroserpens sp. Hel_I_66]|uniref:hypothetical protein n=1 Tax=Psychroserpens sp. Hel_I_66 TaxID=1250004 RepID=UPI0006486BF4|nr:hypothetical protein [Psychroserpens sp. Hel_I_66]
MAINQFITYILPKKAIEAKFGEIPSQLEIKHSEWEKFWEKYTSSDKEDLEPDFEDARTINWWKETKINITELETEIDKIITRASWTDDRIWKSEKAEFDHDVSIGLNNTNEFIDEFMFRTDLTDINLNFLNSMLKICKENDWILMDRNGNLCNPNISDLRQIIKGSDADRFLKNPTNFFDELNNNK